MFTYYDGYPVPNKPYGFCERKAPWKKMGIFIRAQQLCESGGGHPGLPVPNKPDGFCGRKAPLKQIKTMGIGTGQNREAPGALRWPLGTRGGVGVWTRPIGTKGVWGCLLDQTDRDGGEGGSAGPDR